MQLTKQQVQLTLVQKYMISFFCVLEDMCVHALSRIIFSLFVMAEAMLKKIYPELENKGKR